MKIVEVRHPLVRHKLGLMRVAGISTKEFRELASEVATLLTYEATADLETEEVVIDGWAGPGGDAADQGRQGHAGADPARRPGHAAGRAGTDPGRQGRRGRPAARRAHAAADRLLREADRPHGRAHRAHPRPDARHRRHADRHRRHAQGRRLQAHQGIVPGRRAGRIARARSETSGCGGLRRCRSTSGSTKSATSCPAWAMPATRSSAPRHAVSAVRRRHSARMLRAAATRAPCARPAAMRRPPSR